MLLGTGHADLLISGCRTSSGRTQSAPNPGPLQEARKGREVLPTSSAFLGFANSCCQTVRLAAGRKIRAVLATHFEGPCVWSAQAIGIVPGRNRFGG